MFINMYRFFFVIFLALETLQNYGNVTIKLIYINNSQ